LASVRGERVAVGFFVPFFDLLAGLLHGLGAGLLRRHVGYIVVVVDATLS